MTALRSEFVGYVIYIIHAFMGMGRGGQNVRLMDVNVCWVNVLNVFENGYGLMVPDFKKSLLESPLYRLKAKYIIVCKFPGKDVVNFFLFVPMYNYSD